MLEHQVLEGGSLKVKEGDNGALIAFRGELEQGWHEWEESLRPQLQSQVVERVLQVDVYCLGCLYERVVESPLDYLQLVLYSGNHDILPFLLAF